MISWTIARQAPLSMGFSRQEYWSGLHSLLQGICLTQGSNPGLPHCRQILNHLSHQGGYLISQSAWIIAREEFTKKVLRDLLLVSLSLFFFFGLVLVFESDALPRGQGRLVTAGSCSHPWAERTKGGGVVAGVTQQKMEPALWVGEPQRGC